MGALHNREEGQLTLVLARSYLAGGTNGTFSLCDQPICHTIELPWRDNRQNVSWLLHCLIKK